MACADIVCTQLNTRLSILDKYHDATDVKYPVNIEKIKKIKVAWATNLIAVSESFKSKKLALFREIDAHFSTTGSFIPIAREDGNMKTELEQLGTLCAYEDNYKIPFLKTCNNIGSYSDPGYRELVPMSGIRTCNLKTDDDCEISYTILRDTEVRIKITCGDYWAELVYSFDSNKTTAVESHSSKVQITSFNTNIQDNRMHIDLFRCGNNSKNALINTLVEEINKGDNMIPKNAFIQILLNAKMAGDYVQVLANDNIGGSTDTFYVKRSQLWNKRCLQKIVLSAKDDKLPSSQTSSPASSSSASPSGSASSSSSTASSTKKAKVKSYMLYVVQDLNTARDNLCVHAIEKNQKIHDFYKTILDTSPPKFFRISSDAYKEVLLSTDTSTSSIELRTFISQLCTYIVAINAYIKTLKTKSIANGKQLTTLRLKLNELVQLQLINEWSPNVYFILSLSKKTDIPQNSINLGRTIMIPTPTILQRTLKKILEQYPAPNGVLNHNAVRQIQSTMTQQLAKPSKVAAAEAAAESFLTLTLKRQRDDQSDDNESMSETVKPSLRKLSIFSAIKNFFFSKSEFNESYDTIDEDLPEILKSAWSYINDVEVPEPAFFGGGEPLTEQEKKEEDVFHNVINLAYFIVYVFDTIGACIYDDTFIRSIVEKMNDGFDPKILQECALEYMKNNASTFCELYPWKEPNDGTITYKKRVELDEYPYSLQIPVTVTEQREVEVTEQREVEVTEQREVEVTEQREVVEWKQDSGEDNDYIEWRRQYIDMLSSRSEDLENDTTKTLEAVAERLKDPQNTGEKRQSYSEPSTAATSLAPSPNALDGGNKYTPLLSTKLGKLSLKVPKNTKATIL